MHPLYNILKNTPIKRGVNATVWQARDEVLDREVALKEFRGWASRSARARASFSFAHVRRLRLSHPGLAAVHGADCDRGWLVLDYHPSSLADQSDPLPPATVRRLLGDVAATLGYLHERGYVHGAVKPTNLFTTPHGQVLLADGLGARHGDGHTANNAALFLPMDAGEGKYLAPECLLARGEKVGPALDLYALGLTGLELLMGSELYTNLFPLVQAGVVRWDEWHCSDEVLPPVRELLPDVPADLADLLTRLMRKDPVERSDLAATLAVLCPIVPAVRPRKPAPVSVIRTTAPEEPKLEVLSLPAPVLAELSAPLPLPRRSWRGVAAMVGTGLVGVGLGVTGSLISLQPTDPTPALEQPAPTIVSSKPVEPPPPNAEIAKLSARAEQLERERAAAVAASQKAFRELEDQQGQVRRLQGDLANVQQLAEVEKARANRLASELKATQDDAGVASGQVGEHRVRADRLASEVKRLQVDLASARGDIQKRDDAANALRQQVKSAQEEQTRLRAEIEKHKAAKSPPLALMPAPGSRSPSAILASLKQLGARVEVDKAGDQPIVEVDLSGTKATNEHLAMLAGLTNLRVLSLSSTQTGDAGIAHLAKLTKLETLHLHGTQVTDAGMVHLKGLSELKTLHLSSTRVGDAGVAQLAALTGLKALYLTNTPVGDDGLAKLETMRQLHTLHLCTTPLTDAALPHLARLPELRTLDVSYTKLGDAGLASLKDAAKLRELHVSFTRATAQGVKDLQKALPECKIQQ